MAQPCVYPLRSMAVSELTLASGEWRAMRDEPVGVDLLEQNGDGAAVTLFFYNIRLRIVG